MQRSVHPSFGWVKPFVDRQKYHWTVGGGRVKNEVAKNLLKIIDIVSYPFAFKMGVTRVSILFHISTGLYVHMS